MRFKISLKELKTDINCLDDYIVIISTDKIKIYDRVCDHNGGKNFKRWKTYLSMHRWEFDPIKIYKNGIEKKKNLN